MQLNSASARSTLSDASQASIEKPEINIKNEELK